MIYSVFMRKTKGDPNPFPTTLVINNYLNKFVKNDDIVIAFPGYMSTNDYNINNFINAINFPKNTYFTAGMNGKHCLTPFQTIQDAHNNRFTLNINGIANKNTDHAKMMFFLDNNQRLTNVTVPQLLSMNVKAVLIGSSNQSYTTYLNPVADKGEADILLIDGNAIDNNDLAAENIITNFFKNTIIEFPMNDRNNIPDRFLFEQLRRNIALFKGLILPEGFLEDMFTQSINKLFS